MPGILIYRRIPHTDDAIRAIQPSFVPLFHFGFFSKKIFAISAYVTLLRHSYGGFFPCRDPKFAVSLTLRCHKQVMPKRYWIQLRLQRQHPDSALEHSCRDIPNRIQPGEGCGGILRHEVLRKKGEGIKGKLCNND